MIAAQVILKSRSALQPTLKPLCTFELRYPKFIHGEFMTHRMLSRNASSSRAIPTAKLIAEVRSDHDRASPIFWGKNQKGMQAAEELDNEKSIHLRMNYDGQYEQITTYRAAQRAWAAAAGFAVMQAEVLLNLGTHKQIVNRLLEPFSHINVVATATEWDNFFGLRLHHMAQPEMRELARQMWKAYNEAETQEIVPGEYHLPYVTGIDWSYRQCVEWPEGRPFSYEALQADMIKVSVARCARVSYKSLETGKTPTFVEDSVTYAKLNIPGTSNYDPSQPIHASPAEHQATPDDWYIHDGSDGQDPYSDWVHPKEHGNFVGFRQYRKMLPGEACAPLPEEYLAF